jgi:septal ring factor EnvC (AmiA/AmiB activator)
MAAPTFEQRQKEEQAKAKDQPSLETQINDLEYLLHKQRQTILYLKEHILDLEKTIEHFNKENSRIVRENQVLRSANKEIEDQKSLAVSEKTRDEQPWYRRLFY